MSLECVCFYEAQTIIVQLALCAYYALLQNGVIGGARVAQFALQTRTAAVVERPPSDQVRQVPGSLRNVS